MTTLFHAATAAHPILTYAALYMGPGVIVEWSLNRDKYRHASQYPISTFTVLILWTIVWPLVLARRIYRAVHRLVPKSYRHSTY